MGKFVRFDISVDVAASLELAAREADRLDDNDASWKWLIVATHMAAASAMVGYLTDSAGFGALTDRDHDALRLWLDSSDHSEAPPDRIADFPLLVARVAAGHVGSPGEAGVDIADLVASLARLNGLRGRFNHFREEGWLIEKAYALPLVLAGAQLVTRIHGHGWAFRHASLRTKQQVDTCLVKLASVPAA